MSARPQVRVEDDPPAAAARAAAVIAARAAGAIARRGAFRLALSGGRTPGLMLRYLADCGLDWDRVTLFQVDERMVPDDDPRRNLVHLRAALVGAPARIVPLPVDEPNPDEACRRYARRLPPRLDLVHLGLGTDGHTASLVPNDPVLEIGDRQVALTGARYQGTRRMTLTYPALARAREILWLVTGDEKRPALAGLLSGDRRLPAARVVAHEACLIAARAAMPAHSDEADRR